MKYEDCAAIQNFTRGKKTVLAGGCFDILHYGHLSFLTLAKKKGDVLMVALESDEFIRRIKNKKPIHSQEQRAEILAHLDMVDLIILLPLLEEENYFEMVKMIHPSFIALTKGDPHLKQKYSQAREVGASVIQLDFIKGYSSSIIQQYGA
jgi:rfaE bifunctional protein nucleotidyltransferase chain/domain